MPLAPWDAAKDDGGVTLTAVAHALRRRWLLAAIAGVFFAGLMGVLLYFVIPVRYVATAELRIKSHEDRLLPAIDARPRGEGPSDFDIFRRTQASLMTSTFVLTDVLRQPGIRDLPMLAREENPIGFLQNNVQTSYPNDSEVLDVSLQGEDAAQIIKIVDAVTDSYIKEVVTARQEGLRKRLERLRQQYASGEADIRQRREQIHAAKTKVGAQDTNQARIRHQLELERLRSLDEERSNLSRRVHETALKSALLQSAQDNITETPLPDYLVQEQLERDDQYVRLQQEFDLAQQIYASAAAAARPTAPSVQRAASRVQALQGQLNGRRRELESRITRKLRDEMAGDNTSEVSATMLAAEQRILQARLEELTQAHKEQFDFVRQLDDFSAKLQSDEEELAHLLAVNRSRQQEIHELNVELDSPERIKKIQSATIPNSNSSATKWLQLALAGLVTFGLTMAGFVLWDLLEGRANTPRDAADAVGLPLLGTLPSLRRGGWRWISRGALDTAMAEGVDAIRTTLLRRSTQSAGGTVVLITSATGREGKSTLAGHLATSFAKAGRKTLLIDGDMCNPSLSIMFGVSGVGGMCDALRGGDEVEHFIQRTQFENIDVLPAGRSDVSSHKALANGAFGKLLDDVRGNYDVVVVDAGPVLTSTDAVLLGPSADVVVLSTMRDVSRVAKIVDARDRLRTARVEVTGVVVHGVPVELRRSGPRLSPSVAHEGSAEPAMSSA